MLWMRVTACFLMALSAHAQAFATCDDLRLGGKLRDEEIFFRSDKGWLPIKTLADLAPRSRTNVDLLYVVGTPADTPRSGALAIKSGFNSLAAPNPEDETVILKRPEMAKTSCSPRYRLFEGRVNASHYDSYHDDGLKTPSYNDLRRFHVLYPNGQKCRRTDSNRIDGFARGEFRSNLSQFSFDADIVKDGYRELVFWPFRLRSAIAGKHLIEGKRVQIRTYDTSSDGFDCIRFQTFVGPGAFIRINDLEHRSKEGGDNLVWEWPLDD